jgi:hypothetical protein
MSSAFREVINHFNSLKPGTVFTAPGMAQTLNTSNRTVHNFLTPGKYMGVIIKGRLPKVKGNGAKVEYMKVRSISADEIRHITNRNYLIDFIKDLKGFLSEEETVKQETKDMVIKMVKAQPTTRLTDLQIAESCKVKMAFVTLVKSELQTGSRPKPPVYRTRKKKDIIDPKIDPESFYKMKGEDLLKIKEELKHLRATNARLIDELTELSASARLQVEKTPQIGLNDLLN